MQSGHGRVHLMADILSREPVPTSPENSPMKLVSIPANPVPEGAVTGMLKTPDGVNLRFARWQPPPGRKGTVCVFQGRSEFIEKYFEVVRDLRSRGFAVAMIDWRGQGLSDRALSDSRKGHVRDFAEYDIDLETFVREVVLPGLPASFVRNRPVDGRSHSDPQRPPRPPLVRSHGALGTNGWRCIRDDSRALPGRRCRSCGSPD